MADIKPVALPYDYARCVGRDWPECADCLRRTSPDRPNGWQTYQVPPERRPHPAWRCDAAIPAGGEDERG